MMKKIILIAIFSVFLSSNVHAGMYILMSGNVQDAEQTGGGGRIGVGIGYNITDLLSADVSVLDTAQKHSDLSVNTWFASELDGIVYKINLHKAIENVFFNASCGGFTWDKKSGVYESYTVQKDIEVPDPDNPGATITKTVDTTATRTLENYNDNGTSLYYGVGVGYSFNKNVSLGLNWSRFNINSENIDNYALQTKINF